jgi:signal recognition particle subunit SRP54
MRWHWRRRFLLRVSGWRVGLGADNVPAVFGQLEDRFEQVFKKLKGQSRLTEANIQDALRDVRMSLLEADVNFRIVKDFVAEVKAEALGRAVSASLSPSQDFIRILEKALIETMGGTAATLDLARKPPVVLFLLGLQGSGKTTTAAKVALWAKNQGRKPLLVPADVQRPAAVQQLCTLAESVGVAVFQTVAGMTAKEAVQGGLAQADRQGQDVVIIDTAGRLQIDAELMEELRDLKAQANPAYSVLVVDAMTGQEAVNVADAFNQQIGVDGVVMTKLDGDARGGAALSVRKVTGVPIYFAGMGEKMDALEPFHPDRIARRILGMGDVLSLIEKTQQVYDEKKAKSMAQKMRKADFTLDDFREQMQMMRKMGDMKELLAMIPGMSQAIKKLGASGPDPEKEMKRVEAIIDSMTPKERGSPEILNGSRRRRIASGSGTKVEEVNSFLKRFRDAKKVMKRVSKMGPGGLKQLMRGMPGGGFS